MAEVAFYAAGAGLHWLHREEIEDCLYLVAEKLPTPRDAPQPAVLRRYRSRLLEAYTRAGQPRAPIKARGQQSRVSPTASTTQSTGLSGWSGRIANTIRRWRYSRI